MDESAAFDFDCAAAVVLQIAEDKKAIEMLKAQVGATWGTGGDDAEPVDDFQEQAHKFFN